MTATGPTGNRNIETVVERIGIGRYHFFIMCVVGTAILSDGAEMLVLSLLNATLRERWQLSTSMMGILGSSIFLGFMIGSLCAGPISDRFGRRIPFLCAIFGVGVCGLLSSFAHSFTTLVISRSMVGLCVGSVAPISATIFTEFLPAKRRGMYLVLLQMYFTGGEVLLALFAWFVMPNMESDRWRQLLLAASIPAFFAFLVALIFLPESPRYLALTNQKQRLSAVLSKMAQWNGAAPVTEEELECACLLPLPTKDRGSVKELLKPAFRSTTLLLWVIWFVQSFVFYGLIYILPETFGAVDSSPSAVMPQVIISALAEIPAPLFCLLTIEISWIGRRRTMAFCMFLCGLSTLLCALHSSSFTITSAIAKSAISGSFSVVYPYTSEVYSTKERTTGIGMGSAMSRVGGILTPLISESLRTVSFMAPFIAYACVSFFGSVAAACLPIETAGRNLDADRSEQTSLLGSDSEKGKDYGCIEVVPSQPFSSTASTRVQRM